jgi:hypothetical protein
VLLDTFMKSQAAGADAKAMMDKMSPSMRNLARRFIEGKIIQQDWGKALQGFTPVQAAQMSQFATMERRAKGFNQAIRNGLPGSQTYTEAIKKMTGGANGLNTTLQLTGESTAGTAERIKRIQDAARGAGKNVSGWASTQKLFNVQLDMFKERVQVIGVRLGTALIPRVLFAAKAFGGLLDFVQQNSAWLKPLAITLGSLAATVFLVGKATAAWAAITKVVTVATKVWAAGQWLLNVALDANPIGIMIVAIAALAAGIIYAYKTPRRSARSSMRSASGSSRPARMSSSGARTSGTGWLTGSTRQSPQPRTCTAASSAGSRKCGRASSASASRSRIT